MANEKRLIDAVRYREVLDRYINAPHVKMGCSYSGGMSTAIGTCISFLDNQPTVDAVEVVHGRWLKTENGIRKNINTGEMVMAYMHDCSVCGWHTGNQGRNFNYCPNCGAKMDGDGNG